MNNKLDQYDFSTASQQGETGFEMFQGKTDGRLFFRFNDSAGKAILFSQGYTTAKGRENGMSSVQRNATEESRFDKIYLKDGKSFQFVLFAGNKQEIARSIVFDSEKKMLSALDFFKKFVKNDGHFDITENMAAQPQKKQKFIPPESNAELDIALQSELDDIKTDKKGAEILQNPSKFLENEENTEGVLQQSETSAREVFRIELYRPSADAVVKGKIIHALSKEEALLDGLNDDTMNTFISKYFTTDASDATVAKSKDVRILKPATPPVIPEVNVEMTVQTKGRTTQSISQNEAFDIHLTTQLLPSEMTFYAVIAAVNLETREKSLVIERQINFQNGKSIVNMPPQLLKRGMYRLTSSLSIEKQPERLSYYGTCLAQVI